jgi:hypothetical protein
MAEDSTSYREDVEQLRRRFAEFRQTHAARSRLPEELWGEAAQLARRDGIPATARALRVERPSLQKWTDRFQPRSSTKLRKPWRRQWRSGSCGTAGGQRGSGDQLPGRSRIAAGEQAAVRVERHGN